MLEQRQAEREHRTNNCPVSNVFKHFQTTRIHEKTVGWLARVRCVTFWSKVMTNPCTV